MFMTTDTAESWARQIHTAAGQTVESVLRIGRLFIAAKGALPYGEFCRMFTEHLVPFDRHAAAKLMRVAAHPVLSNVALVPHLPPSWSVLVELSRIPNETLEHGITEGRLTASITRREVNEWLTQTRQLVAPAPAEPSVPMTRALRQLRMVKVKQMADEGHRSDQIAEEVGLTVEGLKAAMKKAGIVCVADKVAGRTRRLNADRIVDHIVQSAEDIAVDERLINFATLSGDRLDGWIVSLTGSQRAIGHLVGRLRKQKERYDSDQKTHTAHVEDPSGADQSDGGAPGVREPAPVHPVAR